jgi:hypothetical protein
MIRENEIFDLKYHIADYVYQRLIVFKNKFENKESPASMIFKDEELLSGKELSYEESDEIWIKILDEMIFPFECLSNPEKFEDLNSEERKIKMAKGLELFAKHFEDLWI